jgi:hypothetical protein
MGILNLSQLNSLDSKPIFREQARKVGDALGFGF